MDVPYLYVNVSVQETSEELGLVDQLHNSKPEKMCINYDIPVAQCACFIIYTIKVYK